MTDNGSVPEAPPAHPIDFEQQAKALGECLDYFAELAKNLNNAMVRHPNTQGLVDQIIGAGPYNRAVARIPDRIAASVQNETILYGKALMQARSKSNGNSHHGLFAALGAIHHPLLHVAKNLTIELGKLGFTYQVDYDGRTVSVPLHELKFDFDTNGSVLTSSNRTLNGDVVLPEGFVIMEQTAADSDVPLFIKARRKTYGKIVDANGRALDPDLMSKVLWTAIGGRGKNIYDPSDRKNGKPKNDVLASWGIDDMEDANNFLIDTIQALKHHHSYDPSTLWEYGMEEARKRLTPHLSALAIARETIAASQQAGGTPKIMRSHLPIYHARVIDNVAEFFGLHLPELGDADQRQAVLIANSLAAITP